MFNRNVRLLKLRVIATPMVRLRYKVKHVCILHVFTSRLSHVLFPGLGGVNFLIFWYFVALMDNSVFKLHHDQILSRVRIT